MAAHQAPPSLGLSRQEHWSGLPFPSPMHGSEKWKGSRSVVSDSSRPRGLQPTRHLHPWDFLGKSTGVGCHRLLLLPWNLASSGKDRLWKANKGTRQFQIVVSAGKKVNWAMWSGVDCTTLSVSAIKEGLFEEMTLDLTLNGNQKKGAMKNHRANSTFLTRRPDFGWRLGGRDCMGHTHNTWFLSPELRSCLLWTGLCPTPPIYMLKS